jgi:hypothetical protein
MELIILFFAFILLCFYIFHGLFSKRGTAFYKKLGDNFNLYSQRGAIEEIAEQNRAVMRRVVKIEERIGEVEGKVEELLRILKSENKGRRDLINKTNR